MYQLVLTKKARKNLQKLDKRYRHRFFIAFIKVRKNPYIGKPLSGDYEGGYSLRVWPYRVIYKIKNDELVVHVIMIRHRQGAYK